MSGDATGNDDTVTMRMDRVAVDTDDQARITVQSPLPVALRRVLPLLESLDIEALTAHATTATRDDGSTLHTYAFTVRADALGRDEAAHVATACEATFDAMWRGLSDVDDFNALVLAADLSWQQVAVLRALGRYLGQTRLPYGQDRIQQVLVGHPAATRAVVELFEARFGAPDHATTNEPQRCAAVRDAQAHLDKHIAEVVNLDTDRVLRAYNTLINAAVRTNAFRPDALTDTCPWLAFKFRSGVIEELPQPRPKFEIFVYSPTVEGVHLRFGPVSRGGLRWSDRLDDYRTEVLGLVKAQAVKNAVIVPAGAKGVFVPKRLRQEAPGKRPISAVVDRAVGVAAYRQFISGLLDLTDNRADDGSTVAPRSVLCYDEPDPYLVVAADKGTATFSDTANKIAVDRAFWLKDAFASGGATGFDHKAMGITARGAWVSAAHHLRQLGIDVHRDDFSAVGIGDMSGDVFGNGMLLSPHLGLIAAFDHRHIFCDPHPDRAAAFAERTRLFNMASSTWADYDRSALSAGGGVWSRDAKIIPITRNLRAVLGVSEQTLTLTPDGLIRAILSAPVDLLWNGGIGTYVKARDESNASIGDKFNDGVRVDADHVRARAIVEGGNLGVSAQGRIEYARGGGLINSDAIDNAAGVDCSDHEVNIKILLDSVRDTGFDVADRNRLLSAMTEQVAALVLNNNVTHNYILSSALHEAVGVIHVHAHMVADLETRRDLHRVRENLPLPEEFERLVATSEGLTAPQLATLLAHVKLDLKTSLIQSGVFDDPYFAPILLRYFPPVLRDRFADHIDAHPLRNDILATVVVNNMVAVGGLTYAYRLADDTGATIDDVIRVYSVAAEVFNFPALVHKIQAADLPMQVTNMLTIEARRLLDRASRWLLSNRPQPVQIAAEVARFRPTIAKLGRNVRTLLRGSESETVAAAIRAAIDQGVPRTIAYTVSESLYVFSLLDIVETENETSSVNTRALAATYFALSDHLGIDDLLVAVSALPHGDRWHAQARLALREDLYRSLKSLTIDVINTTYPRADDDPWHRIQQWEELNQSRVQRSRRSLDELRSHAPHHLAALSVAATHIRRMTTTGH